MTEPTLSSLGSGVSAQELIIVGACLTALAACLGKTRTAVFLGIPTLLVTGLASVIGWLTGVGDNGPPDSTTRPTATPSRALPAGSGTGPAAGTGGRGHSYWPVWVLGTTTLLIAVVAGLLLFTAVTRARREDFVLDGTAHGRDDGGHGIDDDPDHYPVWADDCDVTDPETGPPPTKPWPTRGAGSPRLDPFSTRMNQLAHDFVTHVVAHHNRPAVVDLQAPATQRFVTAFTYATDLFLDRSPRDPALISAAISEAERRWTLVKQDHGHLGDDTGNPGIEEW
ncbi:hypothetical protein I6A60_31700 [Frankia sp. AgB1.9]|uniref:hypothetical protein n=1 Tax=unclassified Frankia TaxID=2632575 RepID=UPI001933E6B0|nr:MULTISPECIES: hypothetical protein [unclassified Frankia]MBL7493826.1 hypothetical protein [Frankia sp. AgW1.1]MBL7552393.1 hypothetical protein [Frankia sp. AgB1.9]MBL7619634.1 hypothetical protein [Frankia sp. AgB1.8]